MCLYIDVDSDYETLATGWRNARKPHECRECRREISPGERYWYQKYVDHYDGRAGTYKMCGHCRQLITVAAREAGCPEAWWWDEVLSTYEDMSFMVDIVREHDFEPGVRLRLMRLWVLARREWCDRTGALLPVEAVA